MEPSGAISELGLTLPTSADAIRRAYLRGVRAHPPERDPEGFRRIRDAYELLKDAPWLWVANDEARPSEEDDDGGEDGGEDEGTDHGESGSTPTSAPESSSAPEGARSPPAFFQVIVPRALPALSEALSAEDFERAAQLLFDAFGQTRVGEAPAFFPWHVVQTSIGLFKRGKSELAGSLLARYDEWIARRGMLPNGSELSAHIALLGELRALAGHVEPYIVQELARAIEAQRFHPARTVLERAARGDSRLESIFKRHAPMLHAAAWPKRELLAGPSSPDFRAPDFRSERFSWWNAVWIFVLLSNGVRMCVNMADSKPSDTESRSAAAEARDTENEQYSRAQLELRSYELDRSVENGDCAKARELWPQYLEAGRRSGLAFADQAERRRASLLARCPELTELR